LIATKVLKAKIRLFKNIYLDHNCLISYTGELLPKKNIDYRLLMSKLRKSK